MLKLILKIIKWYFLFWVFLLLGSIAAAIVAGVFGGLFGLELNIGVLITGFTAILIAEKILKSRKKQAEKAAAAAAAAAVNPPSGRENSALQNEYAIKLDTYRAQLERLARNIKDRPTAAQVKSIVSTLRKIALEVENDPRDRKKVRSLTDHSGAMIVDLVDKYIKLENQNQSSSNIASTMWEIRSALDTVDTSLKTLLDDMFSNDGAEVSTNIAVLERILDATNPDMRIRMDAAEADVTGKAASEESEAKGVAAGEN